MNAPTVVCDADPNNRFGTEEPMAETDKLEMWAVVELMGHRRLAGKVSEESHFGTPLLRIDVPQDDAFVTQFYGGQSIYCLTPTTEEIARSVAKTNQPKPVHTFEMPQLEAARRHIYPSELPPEAHQEHDEEFEYDDSDDDDDERGF